jgi:hypothetical protein
MKANHENSAAEDKRVDRTSHASDTMSATPTLTTACPIDRLSNVDLLWVQQQLLRGGYLDRPTDADGLIGNRTRHAFANFKRDALYLILS